MRRLLSTICWVLLGAGPLVALAGAQEPAAPSPQEVLDRFVAGLNARDPAVPTCEQLTPDLRNLFSTPEWTELDPRLPQTYSEAVRARGCDWFVAVLNGYVDDGGIPRWQRTEIDAATVVEQTDTLLHLRVPTRGFYDDDGKPLVRSAVADVFLRLEQGRWKLLAPTLLWTLNLPALDPQPTTLADMPRYLTALARAIDRASARQRELIRGYLGTRTPIADRPLPWSGPRSSASDPLRDVLSGSERLADQEPARNDLRAASLRSDGETLTFELRLREAVPDGLYLTFELDQRGPVPSGSEWWSRRTARWSASLIDGWASAWRGDRDALVPVRGARASVTGSVLRVAVPAQEVRDDVRVRRLLRWNVSATLRPAPALPFGPELPQPFVDELPEQDTVERSGGIVHPRGAHEPTPICTTRQKGLRNSAPGFVHVGERVPVRVNNLWNRSNIADARIAALGVTRPFAVGDAIDRAVHVTAPARPGPFRIAIAWLQVDDGQEPPIPPCAGRDLFGVTAFPAGAVLGDDRLPRVAGTWMAATSRSQRDDGGVAGAGGGAGAAWTIAPGCAAGACSIVVRMGDGRRRTYALGKRSYRRVLSTSPRLSGRCTGRADYGAGPRTTIGHAFRERTIELLSVTGSRTTAAGHQQATRLLRRVVVARSPTWQARENSCHGSVRELSRITAKRLFGVPRSAQPRE